MLFRSPLLARAEIALGTNVTFVFATIETGRQILTCRDDFVQRLSPFDRAARLKSDREISEGQFLDFVGSNVLAWTEGDKQRLTGAIQELHTPLVSLALRLPKTVYLVKTTGHEEGNAAYTRTNAIVFPKHELKNTTANLQRLFCHELFHVLSRAQPDLRHRLYAAIGFVPCNELEFPPELLLRKLTNPDAPLNDHCIRLQVAGEDHWAMPILFASTPKYDVARGGEFFDYLQFKLLLVQRDNATGFVQPLANDRRPNLVDPSDVTGFFEQVGRNTAYILHPEEILADNFALLVLQQRQVPSPEIIDRIERVLIDNGAPVPNPR